MKRKTLWVGIVLLLVGASAYYLWRKQSRHEARLSTSLVTVQQTALEDTVQATGEVAPLNRVEIKPPIPGRIERLLVDEGDRVKAGQVLAWMSSTDRAAILDAARAQGEAETKRWEEAYKPTPIIAPLSGSIILRGVVVGQTVDASTVLYAMSDRLIVLAQVDESDIGRVKLNMPTRITLDAYPDQPIDGRVTQILHEGKNVSNVITYGVKIAPLKVPSFFRSQMTANVTLIVASKPDALVLPTAAVQEDPNGGKRVWTPGPDKKPVARPVEVGLETGDQVEILSGLKAGDSVLVRRTRYQAQQAPQGSPLAAGRRGGGGAGQRRGSSR
jgi:membrane fusion protein, macrolide-specific efflux system